LRILYTSIQYCHGVPYSLAFNTATHSAMRSLCCMCRSSAVRSSRSVVVTHCILPEYSWLVRAPSYYIVCNTAFILPSQACGILNEGYPLLCGGLQSAAAERSTELVVLFRLKIKHKGTIYWCCIASSRPSTQRRGNIGQTWTTICTPTITARGMTRGPLRKSNALIVFTLPHLGIPSVLASPSSKC
jgi:hypothetical protein